MDNLQAANRHLCMQFSCRRHGIRDRATCGRKGIYLAAFASVNPQEWKVVSMERSAPNSQAEIKLPDVCSRFGVSCIQPEEMFREMKETF